MNHGPDDILAPSLQGSSSDGRYDDRPKRSRDRDDRGDQRRRDYHRDYRDSGRDSGRDSRYKDSHDTRYRSDRSDRSDRDRNDKYRDHERDRDRGSRDSVRHSRTRSRSPRPRNSAKTTSPELQDVVSLTDRKRRHTQWDIKPKGYEKVSNEMAKLSGLFPLPGAPRPIDYSKLEEAAPEGDSAVPGVIEDSDLNSLKPSQSRMSRRVVVTGFSSSESGPQLDISAIESSIVSVFNKLMASIDLERRTRGESITGVHWNLTKTVVLIDFQTTEQATIAIAFDEDRALSATIARESGSSSAGVIRVQRPEDYIVPEAPIEEDQEMTEEKADNTPISPVVPDSPTKISVAGIPVYLTAEQILELLQAFGAIKAFRLIKDNVTGESKGIAFCEYKNTELSDIACQGLNGMELGENKLRVKKAAQGIAQSKVLIEYTGPQSIAGLANETEAHEPTTVLQMLNMVTLEELADDDEYRDIKENVMEECSKLGKVIDIKIPRPTPGSLVLTAGAQKAQNPGVGRIYVKFDSSLTCSKALKLLGGRKFSDRTIVTSYYSEQNFDMGVF